MQQRLCLRVVLYQLLSGLESGNFEYVTRYAEIMPIAANCVVTSLQVCIIYKLERSIH